MAKLQRRLSDAGNEGKMSEFGNGPIDAETIVILEGVLNEALIGQIQTMARMGYSMDDIEKAQLPIKYREERCFDSEGVYRVGLCGPLGP